MKNINELLTSYVDRLEAYKAAKAAHEKSIDELRASLAAAIVAKDNAAAAGNAPVFDEKRRDIEYLNARISAVTAEKEAPFFSSLEEVKALIADYNNTLQQNTAPIYADMLTHWEAIEADWKQLENISKESHNVIPRLREHFDVYHHFVYGYAVPFDNNASLWDFAQTLKRAGNE